MRFLPGFNWWRKWLGSTSEKEAASYLENKGYGILARNWHCPAGEIDLVARDGDCLVFVEVRSRNAAPVEDAAASVNETKQAKLSRLAKWFVQKHRLQAVLCRFDVLAVAWDNGKKKPRIEHIQGAFESTGN
ncbi:MAG: YraN family protein [Gemmataceae bacterium]|nr:YraN family protein [Gemmataceae bacterium]